MTMAQSTPASDLPSTKRLLAFYLPLVVLAFSQQLTYPLVGSIVSHGPLGEQEFTAYAVGQQVLFLIGAIGAGLITTGMMFCRSGAGMRNYLRMNYALATLSALLQLAACLPGIDGIVFGRLLGLEGDMLRVARNSLLCCIPLQTIFFLRNPYLAILYGAKRSGLTNYATGLRVLLAFAFASAFPRLGWTGWAWGVFASTLPALLETLTTWWLARPFIRMLPAEIPGEAPAPCRRQLAYTIPLSASGLLIHASTVVTSMFLALTPDPVLFRPVHFFVVGIEKPVSSAALRMQTVTVAFRPERPAARRRIVAFALALGVALGCFLLIFAAIPCVAHWYFVTVQNLPTESLAMARRTMLLAAIFPTIYAIRGFLEGYAATRYRTDAVMNGQIAYFLMLVGSLLLFRHVLPVPGYMWGMAAIAIGCISTSIAIMLQLRHSRKTPTEVRV